MKDYSQLNNINQTCKATIKANSIEACPKVSFYRIKQLLAENNIIVGLVVILIGLLEAIFGYKLLKATIFLLGVISTTLFIFILCFQFILPAKVVESENHIALWIVLGFGVLLGVILGFVMSYYKKLFFGILGGLLGYIIGNISYILVLRYIHWNPTAIYWLTVIFCIGLFAVLTILLHKYLVIIATSIIGSYGVIRGLSLIFGSYPSESLIISCIKNKESEQIKELFNLAFIFYMIGFLLLSVGAIAVQLNINEKKDDESDNDSDRDSKNEYLNKGGSLKTKKTESNSVWDNLKGVN